MPFNYMRYKGFYTFGKPAGPLYSALPNPKIGIKTNESKIRPTVKPSLFPKLKDNKL